MSAADEAWQEWATDPDNEGPLIGWERRAFLAGYRRALEDAADARQLCDCGGASPHPVFTESQRAWLAARAAAVAPRETKD